MFGGGYRGGHGGRGKGFGKGPVEHFVSMQVPEDAKGRIIGSGGSNIKALQRIPGVVYVSLQTGKVDIGGTKDAVQEVQMKIQATLNSCLTRSGKPKIERLHVDVGGQPDALSFVSASNRRSVADFSGFRAGRDYYVLCAVPDTDGLAARLRMLEMSSYQRDGHSILVPLDMEQLHATFQEFLGGVSDISPDQVIGVEMRFGATAFFNLSRIANHHYALQNFRALEPHKDFKMQFSCQLKFNVADIEAKLASEGFELMENSSCAIVHLVSLAAGEGSYAIVFVEPSQGQEGDPRMDAVKRKELERIAQCRTAAEVLEVSRNDSKAKIKKAFLKKSLMVHPDKNAYPGSTEAMKILGTAFESLDSGSNSTFKPPLFEVGSAAKELPQITEFLTGKQSYLKEDIVKMEGRLGYRVSVTSKGATDKPAARNFLEKAWKKGGIIAGGILHADEQYSIDSVRFKDKTCYSNGHFFIELDIVKQKALENAGNFQTCPEISLRSPALEEALVELRANPMDPVGKRRALELYMELLAQAQTLAPKLGLCECV